MWRMCGRIELGHKIQLAGCSGEDEQHIERGHKHQLLILIFEVVGGTRGRSDARVRLQQSGHKNQLPVVKFESATGRTCLDSDSNI